MQRIAVVGTTGSGKTVLAAALARRLDAPHIELDALHWGPGWRAAAEAELRTEVTCRLAADRWVCDGNYSMLRDLVWRQADAVLWLDYPLPLVLARLSRRIVRRAVTSELLWNDNQESLRTHLLTKDSLYLWVLKTHQRHRVQYPRALRAAEYAPLDVIRFRNPRAARSWLRSIRVP